MPLSSNSKCKGARPPHKRDPCYSLKVKKKDCKDVYIGVRDRHQAAVIADLKCVWKVCRHGSRGSGSLSIPPERLNFPEAGYGQDEELLAQLRALDTSEQLKSFALAVTELQPQEQHQFPSVWLPPVPSMQPQGDELRDAPPPQQVQQQHRQAQQQQQAQQQEQQQHRQAQQWQREQQQNRQAQQQEQQQEQQQPREVAATVQSAQQGSASGTERSLGNLANGLVENWTPQAAKVLAVADQPSPASVLRALRQLALTGHGGGTLLHIVEAWPRLTQHQVNYVSIAAQAAARSSWGQLECKLRLALKLASHSIGSTNNASACAGVGVPGNVPGAGEAAQGLPPFVPHFIISQAGAAFVAASSAHVAGGAEALRLPLDHLLLVDLGGSLLQETLRDWEKLGLPVQRFVMEAMLVATAQHAWEEMEKRLAAALALAE